MKPIRRKKTIVSSGGVIVWHDGNQYKLCLVKRRNKKTWVLPRGRVEPGESLEQTAVREVKEETGAIGEVVRKLGVVRYSFVSSDGTLMNRIVHFYLMRFVKQSRFVPNPETEAYRWVTFEEALNLLTYESEKDIVRKAQLILNRGKK